ncbi:MAG TPA: ATP-binding protein [Bacteroidales bacterium]|nr:ATP-binding protein [Bacteroidales bacterium]
MPKAGIKVTLLLWLIFSFGVITLEAQPAIGVNMQLVDTLRLNELFSRLEEAGAMEGTAENNAWIETLRRELVNETNNPQAIDFIVSKASNLGLKCRNEFRMPEAIFWYQLAYDAAAIGNRSSMMIQSLNNLGLIYRRTDKYEKAIDAYQRAILLAESTGDSRGVVFALNGLGNIHLELGNLDQAMIYFRDCLYQEQAINNLTGIAINLNNIGHVYRELNDLKRAMEYFLLSLEVNQEIPSQRGIAICYNDIGEIYNLQGDEDTALKYFRMSLEINQLIGDLYYLGVNHLKLAEILFKRQNFSELGVHLDEAIRLSKLTNNRSNLMKSYRMKYETEHMRGNINSAILYLEKAWKLNDSILNENMQRKLLQMQATFNRERSENHIALLQNEKTLTELRLKRQKDYNLLVIAGLVIMLVGLGLLLYLVISKNRAVNALKMTNRDVEQARLQLANYNQQLLISKQEAELNNKLKSQFLANVSHEIRTPLNTVIGFADILSEKITDPQKLSYLENIRSSSRSLLLLIDDILDLSKIEAGKLTPELHSMSLNNLFLELRRIFELQAYQKNIALQFITSADFPDIIVMHEGSLRQILVNLLGNALKFTNSGRIIVEASVLRSDNGYYDLQISISDTGRGIAAEDLNHIFDAFYQSQVHSGFQKGTGLGLTITRRLVELLNGSISVESTPGEGTTFTIVFKEVKSIALRTAFRLANHDRQLSPVALLSKDNTILAMIDALLSELGLTCDLFEDINEMQKYRSTPAYRVALWDIALTEESLQNFAPDDSFECMHILLTSGINESVQATGFHKIIALPDDLQTLKELIANSLFGNPLQHVAPATEALTLDQMGHDKAALLEAYNKALRSQLVQDVMEFARLLTNYGENEKEEQLRDMGRKLEQTAQTIDIEMMNTLMAEFGKRLRPQQESV